MNKKTTHTTTIKKIIFLLPFLLFTIDSFSHTLMSFDFIKKKETSKIILKEDSKTTAAKNLTSLITGDIGFSSFNTDSNDEFSFVLLTNISGTTTIHFTDDGFNSTTGLLGGEGTITWTYTGTLVAGTEVSILLPKNSNTTGTSTVGGIVTGTTSESGSFSMSSTGDSLIAYTGTVGSPTTYIAAIYIGTIGFTNGISTTTSAIPTGLSVASHTAMQNDSSSDNYQYNCVMGNITTVSDLRESLFTIGNFTTGINSENYQAPGCDYLNGILGINDFTETSTSIELFPNPAIYYIQMLGLSEKENYTIYNGLGEKVLAGNISNNGSIDIQSLSNGLYFLAIKNKKPIKFIKK